MDGTFIESCRKGDILLSEKPFAHVMKDGADHELDRICDYCFNRGQMLKCATCKYTFYCNTACQKGGWSYHKRECRYLKRSGPVPDIILLIARIVWKLKKGGAEEKSYYAPGKFRVFGDLDAHAEENWNKQFGAFTGLVVQLAELMGRDNLPVADDLMAIFGRVMGNYFAIQNSGLRDIGMGIYLVASLARHSCDPNAIVVFDGTTLKMRALVDMPQVDWSKITVSYVDLLQMPVERQRDIKNAYFFLCQCRRCLDQEELGLMTSTICQNNGCRAEIPFGTQDRKRQCPKCHQEVSAKTWKKIVEVNKTSENLIMLARPKLIPVTHERSFLQKCMDCLKEQEGLFGPLNMRKVQIQLKIMECCTRQGNQQLGLEVGDPLTKAYKHYYGPYHSKTAFHVLLMFRIALTLQDDVQARYFQREAVDVIRFTHGEAFVMKHIMQLMP